MEKPDPDAPMGEKMEYLEEDFWENFTLGVEEAVEGDEEDDEE